MRATRATLTTDMLLRLCSLPCILILLRSLHILLRYHIWYPMIHIQYFYLSKKTHTHTYIICVYLSTRLYWLYPINFPHFFCICICSYTLFYKSDAASFLTKHSFPPIYIYIFSIFFSSLFFIYNILFCRNVKTIFFADMGLCGIWHFAFNSNHLSIVAGYNGT